MHRVVVGVCAMVVACGSSDTSGGAGGGPSGSSGGSSGGSGSAGTVFSGEVTQGVATFYDTADGSGSCSFDPTPSDLDVAAFDLADFAKSAACGECVKVAGPSGAVTVRIVDSCPDCDAHHLDLSPSAFAKLADPSLGRVSVTYQAVACAVTGPIAYHLKDGSSIYWTAIQIRNHRVPIASVEYQKGGGWVAMKRADYNYFLEEQGVGDQPSGLRVRVTSVEGRAVEDVLSSVDGEKTLPGAAQL